MVDVSEEGCPSVGPKTHVHTHCYENVDECSTDHLQMWSGFSMGSLCSQMIALQSTALKSLCLSVLSYLGLALATVDNDVKVLALLLCTLLCIPVHGYCEKIKAHKDYQFQDYTEVRILLMLQFSQLHLGFKPAAFRQNQSLIYQYNVTYSALIIVKKKIRLFIHLSFARQPKKLGHPLTLTNFGAAELNWGTEVKAAAAAGDWMRLTL